MSVLKTLAGGLAAALVMTGAGASHALTIIPTFDTSITSLSNAAIVEASINQAISFYSVFTNPVTVTIDFKTGNGLGTSLTGVGELSYTNYTNLLKADAHSHPQNTDLATAIANLRYGNDLPMIAETTADLRALGLHVAGTTDGSFDGEIDLNTSIMNFGAGPSGNLYPANPVIQHEIDEVLGMGGPGSLPDQPLGSNVMGAEDLYRYSAPHTASFTTDPSATSYFSIDGGVTDIKNYNQQAGADYGDWVTNCAAQNVQDAYGCQGAAPFGLSLLSPEVIGLQAIGYNVMTAVPEPSDWALMILGFGGVGAAMRRRRVAIAA